jgi:hypothetical protein
VTVRGLAAAPTAMHHDTFPRLTTSLYTVIRAPFATGIALAGPRISGDGYSRRGTAAVSPFGVPFA